MRYGINRFYIQLHFLRIFILLNFYIEFFRKLEMAETAYNYFNNNIWEDNENEFLKDSQINPVARQ